MSWSTLPVCIVSLDTQSSITVILGLIFSTCPNGFQTVSLLVKQTCIFIECDKHSGNQNVSQPSTLVLQKFPNKEVLLGRTKATANRGISRIFSEGIQSMEWTSTLCFQWFMGFSLPMNLSEGAFEYWIALSYLSASHPLSLCCLTLNYNHNTLFVMQQKQTKQKSGKRFC